MDDIQTRDPIELLRTWLADAEESEPNNPTAMCLATADAAGNPSARMVLLKGIEPRGLSFYTNLDSRKAGELAARPRAALCFHWKTLRRQVNIEGPIESVGAIEADAYFATRARESQIGAWASQQSRPLDSRQTLEEDFALAASRFAGGRVPRPPNWSGFRLIPGRIEFWQEQPHRLHDRIRFHRVAEAWESERLYP